MNTSKGELRKAFWRLGCAGALLYTMNRENKIPDEPGEAATAPLCGGVMQTGHQCGMLWGATLGAGNKAYHEFKDKEQAIRAAIDASQQLMESYVRRSKTPYCREVTGCNPSTAPGLIRYFLTAGPLRCMIIGTKWAPEAVQAARIALNESPSDTQKVCVSCASELAKKIGAEEGEEVTVAGFAGGLGLSGRLCGALSAALWFQQLPLARAGKSMMGMKDTKRIMRVFRKETDNVLCCKSITGREFKNAQEHSDFIKDGGCARLISVLSESVTFQKD